MDYKMSYKALLILLSLFFGLYIPTSIRLAVSSPVRAYADREAGGQFQTRDDLLPAVPVDRLGANRPARCHRDDAARIRANVEAQRDSTEADR